MTGALDFMQFKVQFKLPKKKVVTQDHVCLDLKELLHTLKRSEGVTKDTVEFLYVHYTIPANGAVMELVAVDNRGKTGEKAVVLPTENNVILLQPLIDASKKRLDRKDKPHIKLTHAEPVEKPHVVQAFWKASAAPVWN